MTKLVIIEGPQRGASFDVDIGGLIGRAPGCLVRLEGRHLSRVHAKLDKRADGMYVVDQESRNGVFINGAKVKEQLLKRDDEMEIGEFVFVFDPTFDVQTGGDAKGRVTTVVESLGDPFKGDAEWLPIADLVRALSMAEDDKESMKALLEGLMATLPVERGFIVLIEGKGKVLPIAKRAPAGDDEFVVSNVLCHQVLQEKKSAIATDVSRRGPREGKPIMVLCVPLIHREDVLGFIYLDGPPEKTAFTSKDLQKVAVLGVIAGGALALARRLQKTNADLARTKKRLERDAALAAIPKDLEDKISAVALTDNPVLLAGEPGTGKELIAQAIHARSARATGPFIPIHCGAIPAGRLEADLFGREGASAGIFEAAQGGTIFLCEVGAANAEVQGRLLRLLEEHSFNRVGGTKMVRADVRLVASSSADLEARVKEGKFRGDVYWRLAGVTLKLPPLRERREAVPGLVRHFLATLGGRVTGTLEEHVSAEVVEWLKAQAWPGNVDELRVLIEQVLLRVGPAKITKEHLVSRPAAAPPAKAAPAPPPPKPPAPPPVEWKSVET